MKNLKGLKKQGGFIGTAIGIGIAAYSASKNSKNASKAKKGNKELIKEEIELVDVEYAEEERKMAKSMEQVIGEVQLRMSASGFQVPKRSGEEYGFDEKTTGGEKIEPQRNRGNPRRDDDGDRGLAFSSPFNNNKTPVETTYTPTGGNTYAGRGGTFEAYFEELEKEFQQGRLYRKIATEQRKKVIKQGGQNTRSSINSARDSANLSALQSTVGLFI